MFDKTKIAELYPEAENMMFPSMLIWKLPKGKENMLSEICQNGEYFLQEKIDGSFYQFVKTENYSYLFGRTVSRTTGLLTEKISNVPHIKDALNCLPSNTILIGEIYIPGGTSKDVVSIMGCLPEKAIKRQEDAPIHYYVHDIIFYNGQNLLDEFAEDRYDILKNMWDKYNLSKYSFLRLADKIEENLEEEISKILSRGGEGVVLKKRNYFYTPDKRPAWSTIKIKQMDTTDLICTGFCQATKEYTGKEIENWEYWEVGYPTFYDCFEESHCFGGWQYEKQQGQLYNKYRAQRFCDPNLGKTPFGIQDTDKIYRPITKPYFYGWPGAIKIGAYDENGIIKDLGTVSSGLTDEDKKNISKNPEEYLNKVVSLSCMSIDKKEKTLRHPVFKSWRDDKNANDCKIEEIFS